METIERSALPQTGQTGENARRGFETEARVGVLARGSSLSSRYESAASRFAVTIEAAAGEIDATDQIPDHLFDSAVACRLFAYDGEYDHSKAHGGYERVREMMAGLSAIATVSPAFAKAVMDQNFGQMGMVRDYAEPYFRDETLEAIRTGRKQAAFAMTEPQSGSNPRLFSTVACELSDGSFEITGTKDWITGAKRRQIHFVVARHNSSDGQFGLFAVDRTLGDNPSRVHVHRPKDKLGLRGLGEHRVDYERAYVPANSVVINPHPGSLRQIMRHYNVKRVGQAAICIGAGRGALNSALDYCGERFGEAGATMTSIRRSIAQKAIDLQASAELLDWSIHQLTDHDDLTGAPSGMAKIHASRVAYELIDGCVQACGAKGLSKELPIERLLRDVRMLNVAGGATDVILGTVAKRIEAIAAV